MKVDALDKNDKIIKHVKNGIFGDNKPFKAF